MSETTTPRVWPDAVAKAKIAGDRWYVTAGSVPVAHGGPSGLTHYQWAVVTEGDLDQATAESLAACLRGEHAAELAAARAEVERLQDDVKRYASDAKQAEDAWSEAPFRSWRDAAEDWRSVADARAAELAAARAGVEQLRTEVEHLNAWAINVLDAVSAPLATAADGLEALVPPGRQDVSVADIHAVHLQIAEAMRGTAAMINNDRAALKQAIASQGGDRG